MKIKLQTKTNIDFSKADKESANDIIFENVIRPVMRKSKSMLEDAFSKEVDIRGNKYEKLSKGYQEFKNEFAPGKPIMVAGGTLVNSIKLSTNKKDVKGSVFSDSNNQEYLDHLTGNAKRHLPQRKWFFTKSEERDMFETEDMMKKEFDIAIDNFSKKFASHLVGSFRNLGEEIKIK